MKRKVEISKTRTEEITYTEVVQFEEYWVLRGVVTNSQGRKNVIKEAEFDTPPTQTDIAKFLSENKDVEFCSVEHNFRLK